MCMSTNNQGKKACAIIQIPFLMDKDSFPSKKILAQAIL